MRSYDLFDEEWSSDLEGMVRDRARRVLQEMSWNDDDDGDDFVDEDYSFGDEEEEEEDED